MSRYLISLTVRHEAIDYDFYKKLAARNSYDFYIVRPTDPVVYRNMTFVPRCTTDDVNMHDVIKALDANSPLIVTYDLQLIDN